MKTKYTSRAHSGLVADHLEGQDAHQDWQADRLGQATMMFSSLQRVGAI